MSATTNSPMVSMPIAQYQSDDFLTYVYSDACHEMIVGNALGGTCDLFASAGFAAACTFLCCGCGCLGDRLRT
ncbi:MAG: hypothetical protein G01um101470_103 [Parcubacteria group bacterium Gr01-1014_70]|nr:MAG: hypothetical protein G01um101470_103 [Parcubacteria group bacterium Gr01-1014_70]